MTIARSAIIVLTLALLLPLAVHAAPAPVSGRVSITPPLPVTGQSQASFYVVREGAPAADFGTRVATQQVFNAAAFDYNFTIPDGLITGSQPYRLVVYISNGSGQNRGGWVRVAPNGGARLDFNATAYTGNLPSASTGLVALALGLAMAAVTAVLVLWRRKRLRASARGPLAV